MAVIIYYYQAMRRQKAVGLSAFVNPRTEIPNKLLSLPSKNISMIDEVNSYLASEVQSLDLHDNRLTSLKGVEQFTCLRELDISQNKLQRCEQLSRLRELPHLKKLYLGNNPFLNEPIPQAILQLILDKETDIQILSFEVLSTLKDVEEREIKIIFLKNYIQKLGLHTQLRKKGGVAHQKIAMEAEQVLNKLVPQFYTLIEDPKLIGKIKREAIDKKKQSRESIGEALQVAKHQRQQKIDELVKNIVQILHTSDEFKKSQSFMLEVNLNDNTITFSPQRKRQNIPDNMSLGSGEFSPVKYIEMSKDDASIEDITFTNVKQPQTAANTHTKQFDAPRINEQTLQMSAHRQASPSKSDFDMLETARKSLDTKTLSQKVKQHSTFRQNVQSHIKKMKEKEIVTSKIAESQYIQQRDTPTNSQKKAFELSKVKKGLSTTPKSLSSKKNNFIKVIQQNDESQQNKESVEEKEPPRQEQPKILNLSILNQSSIQIGDHPTPQTIEAIYFKNLAKTNPMFTLLFSPSSSLNNQQKDEILQALKFDHKEKFIQLLKQRLSNKRLMREIEQLRNETQNIISNNRRVYQQYNVYKEQFEWADERQRTVQAKNEQLGNLLKEIEIREKKKTTALNILENNYKKLKEACAEKHQHIIFLQNAQQRQQTLRQKRDNFILRRYIKEINNKAVLWSKVLKHGQKVAKNRQKLLLMWGMQSFSFNRHQERAARHQLRTHELSILRNYLKEWKFYKQLQKKQKRAMKWVFKLRGGEAIQVLKRNQADSKIKKLKQIWSKRFLNEHLYKKTIKTWKQMKKQASNKLQKANQHIKSTIKHKIFNALRKIVITRKQNIQSIYQKRTQRLIGQQFKRMIYIMRKETVEIEERYRKSITLRQQLQRKTYANQFNTHAREILQLKQKKKTLKNYFISKNVIIFKKINKMVKSKLNKLSSFCRLLKFRVITRMMRREKSSNDYSQLLIKRQKTQLLKNLRINWHKQSIFHRSEQKLGLIIEAKLKFLKLTFLKRLQVCKLKGKNYVKHRAIQQLSHQMDLNDKNAIDLIRNQKQQISRCEKQIHFLKAQIHEQSLRELGLISEKQEMMLSISQSYEIMMELRREVDSIRSQYGDQQQKYNSLVALYNQSVAALQKKQGDYQWLYDSLRSHQIIPK